MEIIYNERTEVEINTRANDLAKESFKIWK